MTPATTRRTRGNSGTRGTGATAPRAQGPVTLRDQLMEMFLILEAPFAVTGDKHCSDLIQARAPLLAVALEDAAKKNPVLKRWLERAIEGGSLATVAVCALSIVVPVVTHHIPGRETVDPFAWFLPRSPEEAAAKQAMADQMREAAERAAAGNGSTAPGADDTGD